MRTAVRGLVISFGVAAAAAVAGCGYGVREQRLPETGATLEGTITYGSEKVHYAEVRVIGDSTSAVGRVEEDGRYKVENVPLGEVKVTVNTDAAKGDYTSLTMSKSYKGPKGEGAAGGGPPPKFVGVPGKYAEPETSGLGTTIAAGANTYDIKIKK